MHQTNIFSYAFFLCLRYEKDLFWLTANKTWFKKNTKRNISIEVLKEHVIKAYDSW